LQKKFQEKEKGVAKKKKGGSLCGPGDNGGGKKVLKRKTPLPKGEKTRGEGGVLAKKKSCQAGESGGPHPEKKGG